jgi:HAD superfamily hydrolase (TIGR01509 family)
VSAIIFDCDGVLADTERYGHLPAFNQTFREFGLPVQWSEAEYGRRLLIGGGKERMASLLTPEFIAEAKLPRESASQLMEIGRWHQRKTAIYTEMVVQGKLSPRPGIRRLVAAAQDAGWTLAVASTSAEAAVRAILEYAVGKGRAERFDLILAGDVVAHKKPAPDIYRLGLERLGVPPSQVLVIEDSRNGLLAARGAGLRCLVTVNGYTKDEDSSEAVLVVTSLGDPDGEKTKVIANRSSARPGEWVTLPDLEVCLSRTGPADQPQAVGYEAHKSTDLGGTLG